MEFFDIYNKWSELVDNEIVTAPNQIHLMDALIREWNAKGRPDWVNISDARLSKLSAVRANSVYSAKKQLELSGYISTRKAVKGSSLPSYSLNPFQTLFNTQNNPQNGNVAGSQREVSGKLADAVPSYTEKETEKEKSTTGTTDAVALWQQEIGQMNGFVIQQFQQDMAALQRTRTEEQAASIMTYAIQEAAMSGARNPKFVFAIVKRVQDENLADGNEARARAAERKHSSPKRNKPNRQNDYNDAAFAEEDAAFAALLAEQGQGGQ